MSHVPSQINCLQRRDWTSPVRGGHAGQGWVVKGNRAGGGDGRGGLGPG